MKIHSFRVCSLLANDVQPALKELHARGDGVVKY